MRVSWSVFKNFVVTKSLNIQYIDIGNYYYLKAFDGYFVLDCELDKNSSDTTELDDFTNNFQSASNKKLVPNDADGANIIRPKAAKAGWTYYFTAPELETSVLNSIYHKDHLGQDLNVTTVKFYDSNNNELTTQNDCDALCVKTVFSFEPPWDYEVIGGTIKTISTVTEDVRVWVVAVPDIPANQGGSKVMVENVNLKFVDSNNGIEADGRAAKYLPYHAIYHTNKLQMIVTHPVGHKQKIMIAFELYKA